MDETADTPPPSGAGRQDEPGDLLAAARAVLEAIEATALERSSVWTEQAFEQLALLVFGAQYEAIAPYRSWCDYELGQRGRQASDVRRWRDIPALPIQAFKRTRVAAHAAAADASVWESSTTTGAVPSRHHLPDVTLYETSLLAAARAALVPDRTPPRLTCVQLQPSTADLPRSSLSHMFDLLRVHLCADGDVYSLAPDAAWRRLAEAAEQERPVLVLATSFELVHLFDGNEQEAAIQLPSGSRLVDTGGYKGRSRELTREQLVQTVEQRLGIPAAMCENEYGMSELSSQAYLGTIAAAVGSPLPGVGDAAALGDGARVRWQAPWFRTRVVHPTTLAEVADGERGLLVHYDLANVYSCAAIRTEDVGVRRGNSYELAGRADGAELRGCSLRIEEALQL